MRQQRERRVVLILLACTLIPVVFMVVRARTATTQRGRLTESHPLRKTMREVDAAFDVSSTEETVRARFLWGVDGVETEGIEEGCGSVVSGSRAASDGRSTSFATRALSAGSSGTTFKFDEATQLHVASACEELRQQTWVQRDTATATEGGGGRVQCFLDDFREWLANGTVMEDVAAYNMLGGGAAVDPSSFGTTFPVRSNVSDQALSAFVASSAGALWQPYIGATGRDQPLRFVSISADLKLRSSAKRLEAKANQEVVQAFTDTLNAKAPPSAGKAIASASGLWSWMIAQSTLPYEAMLGSMRTLLVCLFALLLLSQSLPLTCIVAVIVGCATLTMLALLVASGWALGSTEAVLACITPAMLTPPAALVIRAYTRASRGTSIQTRTARAIKAFERAGVSIFSNWLAMTVALAPMLLSQLMAEFKIAAALCFVAISIGSWICVALPYLLAELGPEAKRPGWPLRGSLPYYLLPLLKEHDKIAIEDEPPCTWKWFFARERKRKAAAAAAAADEAARAAADRASRVRRGAVVAPMQDQPIQTTKEKRRRRSIDLFEQAEADLARRKAETLAAKSKYAGRTSAPSVAGMQANLMKGGPPSPSKGTLAQRPSRPGVLDA